MPMRWERGKGECGAVRGEPQLTHLLQCPPQSVTIGLCVCQSTFHVFRKVGRLRVRRRRQRRGPSGLGRCAITVPTRPSFHSLFVSALLRRSPSTSLGKNGHISLCGRLHTPFTLFVHGARQRAPSYPSHSFLHTASAGSAAGTRRGCYGVSMWSNALCGGAQLASIACTHKAFSLPLQ